MPTEDQGYWPRRTWAAVALLVGESVVPAALIGACQLAGSPVMESLQPRTVSAVEWVAGGLFLAHVAYSVALVVAMRGWRLQAAGVGFLLLPIVAVAALGASLAAGGVYP